MCAMGLLHLVAARQDRHSKSGVLLGMAPLRLITGSLMMMDGSTKAGIWDILTGVINLVVVATTL